MIVYFLAMNGKWCSIYDSSALFMTLQQYAFNTSIYDSSALFMTPQVLAWEMPAKKTLMATQS